MSIGSNRGANLFIIEDPVWGRLKDGENRLDHILFPHPFAFGLFFALAGFFLMRLFLV